MKKIKTLLIAIILIALIFINTKCNIDSNPKDDIEQGIEAYAANNYDDAFALLSKNDTTTEFKENAQANFCLGAIYYLGDGVGKNNIEAIKWLTIAAKKGNVQAAHDLAIIYQDGGNGVTVNNTEAIKWYNKAAEEGYVNSQLNLAIIYDQGKMVKQDYAAALKWYTKAVEQKSADAQFDLALMYANGHGVDVNEKEALRLLHLSAKQGLVKAKDLLKKMGIAE